MPKIEVKDIVGCGINFCESEIFFTHNGVYDSNFKSLHFYLKEPAFKNVVIRDYYASISLHSINEEVKFNFGKDPFKFNLESLYKKI